MSKTVFTVGRSEESDFRIDDDESVSRVHAEIEISKDGRLFVVDCNSANHTFLKLGDSMKRIFQAVVDNQGILVFGKKEMSVAHLIREIQLLDRIRVH